MKTLNITAMKIPHIKIQNYKRQKEEENHYKKAPLKRLLLQNKIQTKKVKKDNKMIYLKRKNF